MIYWSDAESIIKLKNVLDQNQIVLASGDTVLGLWGNITDLAFEQMNKIKQRHGKPYLITIGSAMQLSKFTDQLLTENLQTLIETCWPGPVTLIFQARQNLPSWMKSQEGTIALRVPDHEGLSEVLRNFDGLFSTSANIHGKSIPNCIDQVDPLIESQVHLICADRDQICYSQSPSTILDCSSGKIEVVRSGAYSVDQLKDLLT